MAVVKVVEKTGEIDGKPINWNVLAITGYMHDDYQTLELKLSKTEAMLARLLLNSEGDVPTTNSGPANAEEKEAFGENIKKQKTILDDDDDESEGWL